MFDESEFEVELEVKCNKSMFVGPRWSKRTLKLIGTTLYFNVKACLEPYLFTKGSTTTKLKPEYACNRKFAFQLASKDGAVYAFNANSEVLREKCITIFNFSSRSHKWFYPFLEENDMDSGFISSGICRSQDYHERLTIQRRINKYEKLCESRNETLSDNDWFASENLVTAEVSATSSVRRPPLAKVISSFFSGLRTAKLVPQSSVRNRTNTLTNPPERDLTAEELQEKEAAAQRRALVRVQRMWRSRSTRLKVLSSLSHCGYSSEQVELLVNKVQSKFRILQAVRIAATLRAQCPQIMLVSIESCHIDEMESSSELSCEVAGLAFSRPKKSRRKKHAGFSQSSKHFLQIASPHRSDKSGRNGVALVAGTSQLDYLSFTVVRRDKGAVSALFGEQTRGVGVVSVLMNSFCCTTSAFVSGLRASVGLRSHGRSAERVETTLHQAAAPGAREGRSQHHGVRGRDEVA